MIEIDKIKIVHVEASSRCNSRCPMCSRFTADGYVQPGLKEIDLTDEVFYKLFTKDFTDQLDHVYFSGVYGDPCLNKLLPEFVNYLIDNGCKSVSIDTNGGYRNEEWWAKLARSNVLINFAIDGTDNQTLDMYRIGVKYDKAYANLKSFITAGGEAQWNFIVFKHNEYQVDIAKQLAADLGIKFRIKVTQKFRGRKNHKVMIDGVHVNTLEPPDEESFRHSNVGTQEHIPISIFRYNDYSKFQHLNGSKITCKVQQRQEIYLTSTGLVMPCCYLATYKHDSPGVSQFNNLYDLEKFNLKILSLIEILKNFESISDKWDKTIQEGNLITCLHTCGNKINTTLYHDDTLHKATILNQK
jgi:MoaA/NifB/PqqE/SkfB family radical SAM enzyme